MTVYLVTGGCGFIGSAIVRRLVGDGHRVRVLDNGSRGNRARLGVAVSHVDLIEADIRNPEAVHRAMAGVESVIHLAAVNGTANFYRVPELVLDVGVRGMLNVVDAMKTLGTPELIVASSSEVYQTPPRVPTDESVPLVIPDPLNPRYSYAGSKLISELIALNAGRESISRVLVVRPHNVYGPDMGEEHVIPQLVLRLRSLAPSADRSIRLPIQGSGRETRAFVYVDDLVEGLVKVLANGEHLGIYNIGTDEEVAIADLARAIGEVMDLHVEVVGGALQPGSTLRRCPDLTRIRELGYRPQVTLRDGLERTIDWYLRNA